MSTTERGVSRRSVVKGAAWTAPVIVVASAAPAMAASGPAAVTTTVATAQSGSNLDVSLSFVNANMGATSNPTTLAVRFSPTAGTVDPAAPINIVTTGAAWSYVSSTVVGTVVTFNFTSTGIPGATTPTGTSTCTLAFKIKVNGGTSAGAINVTANTASGAVLPGTGTWA